MKKIVIHRAGSYDELVLEQHPDLEPGPGEVVVETRAIGVNFADCIVRMGLYESAKKYVGWPITPGFEFAGEASAGGGGGRDVRGGAGCVGVTRFSADATHVRFARLQLFGPPQGFSLEQAAGFPAVFMTA